MRQPIATTQAHPTSTFTSNWTPNATVRPTRNGGEKDEQVNELVIPLSIALAVVILLFLGLLFFVCIYWLKSRQTLANNCQIRDISARSSVELHQVNKGYK